jgi:hypothetical protein
MIQILMIQIQEMMEMRTIAAIVETVGTPIQVTVVMAMTRVAEMEEMVMEQTRDNIILLT